ncbi:LLM class flavin-dependent oxidoreductase [Microbacterium sp. P05]|uniref:LLM class flavin-dependent oxidoreductase n=1 Tax=Microbacterium sp. P05 TaxID=3366948 RepID=UPI003745FEA8
MPDYGHPLTFGTFITPINRPPEQPVLLAQLTESLGYDLVTFQDHPYQPSFLDTWTLISWVASRTERIHIAGNVLNTQLRPPAVLARAVASLDLLSHGRIELALGAGAFGQAIASMGAPALTPPQAVSALAEAVDIIRGIWDVNDLSPLRVDGEFNQVNGARRGPEPAHPVPIWIGAYKPRMLRLTGTKGDGWIPTLSYLQDGDLRRGNQVIDDAAAAAGRDPRLIRRLLNISGEFITQRRGLLQGPPESWVEDLLPMVLADGVSTIILAGDQPATIQVFAQQVIPTLSQLVSTAREDA